MAGPDFTGHSHNQISVDFEDENSPDQQYFVGYFRVNFHALKAQQTMKIRPCIPGKQCKRFSDKPVGTRAKRNNIELELYLEVMY